MCSPIEEAPVEEDKPLARVHNKSLYLSELEGMVPEGSKTQDSAMIINAHVERWIREALLMHEAENNIPKDLNIDQLVLNYRASLVRYNYEKLLVELQLDSTITQEEMLNYYEENKDQHKLEQPILRCYFIKVPKEAPDVEDLERMWQQQNTDSYLKMLDYCRNFADVYMLEDSSWYNLEDISIQLPKSYKLRNDDLRANRNIRTSDETHKYLLRIKDVVKKGELPPIDYVREQATKVILHKRKIKLLEDKKEEIYERETRRNNVKIYSY
ncbi:MAG: hypothetical protein AAGG75_02370 [Bacteroidota bacterium]